MRNGYLTERFWERVTKTETCWLWTGALTEGYGEIQFEGRKWKVHRLVYTMLVGPIPDGLELDHVKARGCTSRACCNPAHLEPVTHAENVRRAEQATKTHCLNDHPLEGDNLEPWALKHRGIRKCKACARDQARARYHREKVPA